MLILGPWGQLPTLIEWVSCQARTVGTICIEKHRGTGHFDSAMLQYATVLQVHGQFVCSSKPNVRALLQDREKHLEITHEIREVQVKLLLMTYDSIVCKMCKHRDRVW